MIRKLKYFIANFGEKDSSTHPVDGGCYPVPTKYSDTKMISEGDVMLLCCWAGHKNLYKGDAWGLGKVTDKKERGGGYYIYYEWMQFIPAISNDTIYNYLKAEKKEGRFITGAAYEPNWLFNIKSSSFLCILSSWK